MNGTTGLLTGGDPAAPFLGLAACLISSLGFGSMFVPVKSYDSGDGIIVQWCMCSAIFFCAIVLNFFTYFPPFQPLAMFGGMFWATGNLMSIPIINRIGIGMGQLIWGVVVCIVGWAVGRFGLFGTKANIPSSPIINYFGVAVVIIGGILLSYVKKGDVNTSATHVRRSASVRNERVASDEEAGNRNMRIAQPTEDVNLNQEEVERLVREQMVEDRPTATNGQLHRQPELDAKRKEKIVAVLMALFAGTMYGLMFTPVIFMQDNRKKFPDAPKDGIDYVFSHFTGIYAVSTVATIIYLIVKRNNPFVNPEIMLPSFASGTLWAIAMFSWFPANDYLSQAITVPINSMLPGCIAAAWSVLYFREIKGRENLRLLGIAILVTVSGVTMIALSRMI